MARPRNDAKRDAIVTAAIDVVARDGLGASTAAIGKAAGVSNGALFTYFATKADLLNHLYVELKRRMATLIVDGCPPDATPREQLEHVWRGSLRWADVHRTERQALIQLGVSKDLTDKSRAVASAPFAPVEALLDQCRAEGVMRDASRMFVASLVMAMVEATVESIAADPAVAERHAAIGFEALWRAMH